MADAEQLITQHIDTWASAIKTKSAAGRGSSKKLELYGIKKLRELILELAVRGLLVPQDPNDEPASVLLEEIAKEKAQLIKEGRLKNKKQIINDEEIPYTLPLGWEWARLPDVCDYTPGKTPSTKNPVFWSSNPGDIPWVSISDMEHFGRVSDTNKKVTQEAAEKIFKYDPVSAGSLLMSFKLTVGKIAILDVDAYHNEAIISIQPFTGLSRDYLFKILPMRAQGGNTKQAIMGHTLNATSLSRLLIPIPPKSEQNRIVAKADELMVICEQLEQQQENSISDYEILVKTLLDALTTASEREGFNTAWNRIASHFHTLFTTESSIDQLKQTILQLAVMGKLVSQDPNDEPASVLLEKIAKEKAKLIKAGKIKKQKPLPQISEHEKPFELPEGWEWCQLEVLSKLITKGSSPKWQGVSYTENSEDVLFITSENVGAFELKLNSEKYVQKSFNDVQPRSILKKNDILMNIVGASIGRTAIFNVERLANINQAVCLIRIFSEFLSLEFILNFFNSSVCISYMFDKQVDNARANLSMSNISKFIIPVPPYEEQARIIAKLNELMAICELLKAKLSSAQTTQLQLADAIAKQAIN